MKLPQVLRAPVLVAGVSSFVFAAACDGAVAPNAPSAAAPSKPLEAAREAPLVYRVPLGDSPSEGPTDARVTLVVFSEFQCPFCAKVVPTLAKLRERHRDDLRVVWKHAPLPFHERAMPAALAAEAARVEGRFWPMHDQLFAHQGALAAADLAEHARNAGVEGARFSTRLDDPALKARVDADLALGAALGVRGTPTFFVNGRKLVGAQGFEVFARLIDEELARADEKLRAGTPRAGLYAALTERGLERAPAEAPTAPPAAGCPLGAKGCAGDGAKARAADDPVNDNSVVTVDVGAAPARGAKDAPITLVLFSDFECPYCKRVEGTLSALEAAFPGKIRVVWKNFPLPFHAGARPAARLALQAHTSGKFWPMHDRLIANEGALDGKSLEGHARALGVAAARDEASLEARVEADVKQGQALGVSGTPTTFINGRRIAGAYPLETFRAIVQQELAKTPAGKNAP